MTLNLKKKKENFVDMAFYIKQNTLFKSACLHHKRLKTAIHFFMKVKKLKEK